MARANIQALLDQSKLDRASLRRLLDALIEADARTPLASDSIKAEYLMLDRSFGDPGGVQEPLRPSIQRDPDTHSRRQSRAVRPVDWERDLRQGSDSPDASRPSPSGVAESIA